MRYVPRSTRIHIGGDEAKLERWTNNEKCRDYVLSRGIDFDIIREYFDIAEGVKDERDFVAERAPYMAENTWNVKKIRTFENAEEAFAECNEKIRKIWNN